MVKTNCDVCRALFPVNEFNGPVIGVLVTMNGEEKLGLCWDCFAGGLREAALLFRKKEQENSDRAAQVGPK